MALSDEHIFKDMQGYKKVTKLKEDHMLPSKLQRYKRAVIFRERAQSALFNQTDDVIDKVYEDICNGISRAEITQKLMNKEYEVQKRKLGYRTANEYYNCALDRMHYNTDIEHARLKDIFYSRYETILEKAIKKGDLNIAKGVLDSMSRIFLGDFNKTQNNIQINSMGDGKVVVTFGFGEKNKDEDENNEEKIEDAEIVE